MKEHQIGALLDPHDQLIDQEDGHWLKIEAWDVSPTKDANQLLSDFFTEVDSVLKEVRSK
jgi:hypothetical protein